jgi:hypothetical protein
VTEGERRAKVADGSPYNEAILPEAKVVEPHAPRPPVVAEEAAPAPREFLRRGDTATDKAEALANGSGTRVPALKKNPSIDSAAADQPAQLADSTGSPTQAQSEAQSAARAVPDSVTTPSGRGYAGTTAARAAATRESTAAGSMASAGAAGAVPPSTSAASAPAAPPPAASAPAGPPPAVAARSQSPSANDAVLSPRTAALAARATPSRDGAPEPEDRDQPALAKPKPATAPTQPKDPKTWLQQIADLRAEGKTAQADAEMQRFRAAFPAYEAKPGPTGRSEPPK